jgi:signal transduction histidine kinase
MPTLTVIQGPDRGKTFEVDGETGVIGRDPHCEISLRDPGCSRAHARLVRKGTRYVLVDAGSANGTYINGIRVSEAEIEAGDQVRVGNSILSVGRPTEDGTLVDDRGLPIRVDTEGRVDSSIMATAPAGADPHLAFAGGEDMAQMRTSLVGLRALYRIADMLAHGYDIDRLLQNILDMVFDVVDADRGFVLLKDDTTGTMVPRAIRYREELLEEIRRQQEATEDAGTETSIPTETEEEPAEAPPPEPQPPPDAEAQPPIRVSRTIINYVLKRGEGVLSTNAMQDQRFEEGESIKDYGIRSAICVPIKSHDAILGMVYVDTHISQGQFTPEDLKLMTAIGAQTGLAVENARLMESQVQHERLAAVGEAVASLSHSIKNILQGIQGGQHAVESGLKRAEIGTVGVGWDIISRNLNRINALTLNMLSYSRRAAPHFVRSPVNAIIREVAELAQSAAKEKGVTLTTKLATDLPEIEIDPDGINHACLNLVSNAVEAVQPISGKVEITTRAHPDKDEIWIAIADNGPGIPPDEQLKIFQAFYSTKGQKGTGLGLAAAKKIVEEHHGRIALKSKFGEGSTFVIKLPQRQ